MTRALELAAEVARGPLAAQALTKQVIDAGLSTSLADGLAAERAAFVEVFRTEDSRIGVRQLPRARPRQGDVHRPLKPNCRRELEPCRIPARAVREEPQASTDLSISSAAPHGSI